MLRSGRNRRTRPSVGETGTVALGRPDDGASRPLDLDRLIANARRSLPRSHRSLLEQIGVQDAVIYDWPSGVQDLYLTLRTTPPSGQRIAGALALWLQEQRLVAYNGAVLTEALNDVGLSPSTRQAAIDNIAWHEYGHALSVTLASADTKAAGPRLVELLPGGLRRAIDFPGAYAPRAVFDEVIANVYALMIGRL